MAAKDELYDPAVNYNSDSDSELNNAKEWTSPSLSPPTNSCLEDIFIHNSLGCKGGPQADKPEEQAATVKKSFRCRGEDCHKQTDELWDGNHYKCSISKKKDWARLHKFCYDCAHRKRTCPAKACMGAPDAGRKPNKIT